MLTRREPVLLDGFDNESMKNIVPTEADANTVRVDKVENG